MIHKEDIDKIFEAAKVEEVVADYVTLKKRGANLIGLCPFHDEKTPSFYVSPVKGIYKCFGCGKGGHAINFVMEKEQMSYPDALRHLAKKYNIKIVEEEQSPEEQQEQRQLQDYRESLFVVSSFAQKTFTENLYNTDEGKSVGLGYFKERGFRDDIIQKFQLGYSINNRTVFTDNALANGYKFEYLVKSGLTIDFNKDEEKTSEEREATKTAKKYLDRFFARVMFPIHNISGRVIAFGGRTLLTDKKVAKYINSPESEIYHKSDVLYGIYFAKNEIIKQDNCLLVEGYTDVISMHQAGVENVVASAGTSLTVEQILLIKRYTNNITILYDGDAAGIKASMRGINLILEKGLNVKVVLFPDGEDPDSYSKKVSSSELRDFILQHTKDFILFKADFLTDETINDPIKRKEAIGDMADSIVRISDAILRSDYIKKVSVKMGVDEENILIPAITRARGDYTEIRRKELGFEETRKLLEKDILFEQKKTTVSDAEYQERDIIRILINYGNINVFIDTDEKANNIKIGRAHV